MLSVPHWCCSSGNLRSSVTSSVWMQSIHLETALMEMFMKEALFIAYIANIQTNILEEAIEVIQQSVRAFSVLCDHPCFVEHNWQPAGSQGWFPCIFVQKKLTAQLASGHSTDCFMAQWAACVQEKFNAYSVWNMQWIYDLHHHMGTCEILLRKSNITFRHQQTDLIFWGDSHPKHHSGEASIWLYHVTQMWITMQLLWVEPMTEYPATRGDNAFSIAVTKVWILIWLWNHKHIPYLAVTGKLLGVICEYLRNSKSNYVKIDLVVFSWLTTLE